MAKKEKNLSSAQTGDPKSEIRNPKSEKPVMNEIASVRNDIIMDYIGTTVLNPDKVLKSESGGKGIELYEDLLRDSEVRSALQTRKLAVIGKEWEIIPASEDDADVEIAEFVEEVFKGFNYDAFRQALLSGIVLGYKPAEIMWDYRDGVIVIKSIIGKASRRFVFDLEGKPRLLTMSNMSEGEELPDRKFIIFRNASDNGSYYGDGLGSSLYWPVWFRKNGIKFWAIFCDKFGSPTAVGKYPPGTTKEQQDALLAAIEAIQQESGIKIPDTMVIELLEATRAGSINTYETFCAYMDKAINKILLGHSAASESTPGKLGNEQQSVDIRQDYIKADADALCECQNNSLIPWLVDYNFPPSSSPRLRGETGGYPKVWIRTDPEEDLKPLAERDRILVREIGLPVTKKYFYETYGIPQPEDGEELVEVPATPSPFSATEGGQRMSPSGGGAGGGQAYSEIVQTGLKPVSTDQQAIDNLAEKVIPAASDALKKNEEMILDIIKNAGNYDEARAKLQTINLNMDDFTQIIERSILAAEVFGKYTMKGESRAKP